MKFKPFMLRIRTNRLVSSTKCWTSISVTSGNRNFLLTNLCWSWSCSIENDLPESRGLNTSNCPLSDQDAVILHISRKLLWTTPKLRWRSSQTRYEACSTKSADSTVFHVYTCRPWPNSWNIIKISFLNKAQFSLQNFNEPDTLN